MTMFKSIDIKKFGLFKDFEWRTAQVDNFNKLNIIYGRNYSGKTTLSRIFDCVSQETIHPDYTGCIFSLAPDGAGVSAVTNSNLHFDGNVRVYNTDFVKRNLGWLQNENEGEIKSFTLLGSDNVAAQNEIDRINEQLGTIEAQKGLYFEFDEKTKDYNQKERACNNRIQALENKLKDKANRNIKANHYFVKQGENYNVNNLKNDITTIDFRSYSPLTSEQKDLYKSAIDESEKPVITLLPETESHLQEYIDEVNKMVTKKVSLSQTLQELVNNDLLQAWVNQGREINKGSETCAFCGGPISKERWDALNAHFSKESEDLKQSLMRQKEKLSKSIVTIDGFIETKGFVEENIYSSNMEEYQKILISWKTYVEKYKNSINRLISSLDERLVNIFKPLEVVSIIDKPEDYLSLVKTINQFIQKNNSNGQQLESQKKNARTALRIDAVHSFCEDIGYSEELRQQAIEKAVIDAKKTALEALSTQIKTLETQRQEKELEKKDEGKAAQKITELLVKYFGNESLRLEPETVGESSDVEQSTELHTKFVVKRGNNPAKNLSEGERSLVSFCYFIAMMDDELNGMAPEKLVIFIDDPISSLDSSHVFFMFSLIESVIAKPKKYGQLFISTHNLDFLKYLKRVTVPHDEKNKQLVSYYVIEKLRKGSDDYKSIIKPMPTYLKDYVTEYNFHFEQIYKMVKPIGGDRTMKIENSYTLYYNIGNNMRKFLECYLFYKYPNTDDPLKNLDKLFDGNVPAEVNRVVNEYSHLSWGDRGLMALDVPEMERVAKIILKTVRDKDGEHFNSLCESIKEGNDIDLD